jgi:hypothetical protein
MVGEESTRDREALFVMKKILASILIIASLTVAAIAEQLAPYAFPFIGRWNPSENPLLLDDYGLQDIQNLRKDGKHFKGVSGHTAINTNAPSTGGVSFPTILNGFHFRKDQPQESHVIIYAADTSTPTAGKLFQNTTAIPGTGDFSSTVLHSPSAYNDIWRFSNAPAGNMVAANGDETLIWGGNEIEATSFITSSNSTLYTVANANDYSDILSNSRQTADQVATIGGGIDTKTVLLLHGDGVDASTTITDSSGTPKAVTAASSAQIDTAQLKFGSGSIQFNAPSTDYITTADHADWNMADGNFTVEKWIRFAALPATNEAMVLYSQRADASNLAVFSVKNQNSIYSFTLDLRTAGAQAYPVLEYAWGMPVPVINQWYRVALTRGWGGGANAWTVTVDGIALSGTSMTTTYPDVAAALQIGMGTNGIVGIYPTGQTGTYVKATSRFDDNYFPYFATDPAKTLTGVGSGNSWISVNGSVTDQRFNIDLGTATVVTRIYYENYHTGGTGTGVGVKTFNFFGSNSAADFADITYTGGTDWIALTGSSTGFEKHSALNAVDPKYITVTNDSAFQYYSFKFADNWGDAVVMGVRRLELNPVTQIPFNGWMDEVRISKGVARWTANFAVPVRAYSTAQNWWLVGSKRPLQGVKFYVKNANTETSTMTGQEWNGVSWTTLALTDGTKTGTVSLAQTGTVSFPSTTNTSKPRYLNGLSLYWYQFAIDTGTATVYYTTVDAPIQEIRNIWDGVETYPVKCLKYDGTTYKDYTDSVGDGSNSTYADLSSFATTHQLYLGFLEPQQGFSLGFVAGSENSNASVTTVKAWDGSTWVTLTSANDGTDSAGKTLAKGGVISFQAATAGNEFKRAIADEFPLYYYQITVSSNLDADVKVSEITGITAPPAMSVYKFSETFQNKLFLFNEKSGGKNKAIYSVTNAPDIFNGTDSGEIVFGDKTELTAAAVVYNVFTDSAVEQLLVTKKNETWRLSGDTLQTWTLKKISSNVGCVAPLTMVSAETIDTSPDQKRTVAVWVSDRGPVMSTGSSVIPIYDDIKCYWDPNDSRYIPTAWQSKSVGRYDTQTRSYKLLIASGAASTFLNTELEFSFVNKEWTKIYRENATGANPLQSIWPVWDTNGIGYTYGGGKDGKVYRLENGNTWNSVANIAQYLHTKDLILDTERPLFRKSTIKYLRTTYKQKGMGNVTVSHYGDRTLTVSGTNGQSGPAIITNGSTTWYDSQSTNLGQFLYHSLKFSASTAVTDGMELNGFGIYYAPDTTFR